MLTLALCGIVWVLIVSLVIREEGWPNDSIGWIFCGVMSVISFGFSIFIGVGIAAGIGSVLPSKIDTTPSHTAAIVALRSADGVQGDFRGSFFVGVGHIGSQLYYFWYEQDGSAITPRQLAAGKGTYIYEEDRTDAQVQTFDWHFTHRWWAWFAIEDFGQTWRFYVPAGTVKQGYSL